MVRGHGHACVITFGVGKEYTDRFLTACACLLLICNFILSFFTRLHSCALCVGNLQELKHLAGHLKHLKEENTQLRTNFDKVGVKARGTRRIFFASHFVCILFTLAFTLY
jgi:hypothetical protein